MKARLEDSNPLPINKHTVITFTEAEISKKELLIICGELILMNCKVCYKTRNTLCSGNWYSKKETALRRFPITQLLCSKIRLYL